MGSLASTTPFRIFSTSGILVKTDIIHKADFRIISKTCFWACLLNPHDIVRFADRVPKQYATFPLPKKLIACQLLLRKDKFGVIVG